MDARMERSIKSTTANISEELGMTGFQLSDSVQQQKM